MKLRRGEKWLLAFNLLYILAFGWYYFSIKNYEFLWYVWILILIGVLVISTLRKTNFDYFALWGLSLWSFLHMAGGAIPVGDTVLYGIEVWKIANIGDTYLIKMDQVIHAFGFGVSAIVAYQLLRPRAKKMHRGLLYGLIFFIAMGAGALNELIEFVAVVFAPENGVGGYFNTGLDITFNAIGALIALIIVHFKYER